MADRLIFLSDFPLVHERPKRARAQGPEHDALALLRNMVGTRPPVGDDGMGGNVCAYCGNWFGNWDHPEPHCDDDCPWLKAKQYVDEHGR